MSGAVQGLLDLYYKEKEKNKELYDKGYKEGYIKGVQPQIFENWKRSNAKTIKIKSNYISKDKIREKIEPKLKELDKQINEEWKKYGNSKELQDMEDMYNFLQELLEESEIK